MKFFIDLNQRIEVNEKNYFAMRFKLEQELNKSWEILKKNRKNKEEAIRHSKLKKAINIIKANRKFINN